jgi:serine/threonine protein kinase
MDDVSLRYTFLNDGSSGGFGDVLFYSDNNLDRKVAIKTIQDLSELARLRDEISALLKLRSKHVVQVYDIVNPESSFGIVMEYVSGKDLTDRAYFISKGSEYLFYLMWQMASGISDIHAAGVIHRDIKPNNIKVDSEGILKIFDFGLSRNDGLSAKTMGFKGTPVFAAPEQHKYDPTEEVTFTSAVDVYAFALTVLFLFKNVVLVPLVPIQPSVFDCTELDPYPELKTILYSCLNFMPNLRPKMQVVQNCIAKVLNYDKHQALAVYNGKSYILNKSSRKVSLSLSNIASFDLVYNGFSFTLENVTGEVFLNNTMVTSSVEIPGACVVGLGGIHRPHYERNFITFDVSNPEVAI